MERERKFLITHAPGRLGRFPHKMIRQGYLAIPGRGDKNAVEIRLRDEGGKQLLTVKGGRGQSRTEVEVPIAKSSFRSLWRLTKGKRVQKVRYKIPLGQLTVELDVYRGKLRGLMIAEVEFESDRQLRNFRPPQWIGREVTGRDAFNNSRLATQDKPPARSKR
jgi:CYTH domain-containing protein